MKRELSILMMMLFMHFAGIAQLNSSVKSTFEVRKELPAKVYTQLVQSLTPAAYIGSSDKQKKSLLTKVSSDMDGEQMARKVADLVAAVKPEMLRKGFSLATTTSAKTMSYSLSLLKDVEIALKPEAFIGGWKFQKNAWLDEISKVK